ncbi:glycosyltransferase, partial [Patescibacteria group bacterium]|nr:glycosyltransferase [Patescibacteria group bacterium]
MKIGIFSDSFYPEIKGGGEMMAWRLAKQYLIMGYEVVVFTATQDKKNEVWGQLEGGFKIYRFFSDYHRGLTAYFAFFNYQVVFKIAEVLKKEKLDIVHIHNIHHYLSYYSLVLLKRRKIPSVLTVHE